MLSVQRSKGNKHRLLSYLRVKSVLGKFMLFIKFLIKELYEGFENFYENFNCTEA